MKNRLISIFCLLALLMSSFVFVGAVSAEELEEVEYDLDEIEIVETTQVVTAITTSPADVSVSIDESVISAPSEEEAPVAEVPALTGPAANGFFPFAIRHETHAGAPVIIMSFRLPVGVDPSILVEPDFEDGGYLFAMRHILLSDTVTVTEDKVVTQTVGFATEDNDPAGIMQVLRPSIEFYEDGFIGQLELDRSSITTVTTGTERYSFPIRRVVEHANLDRNDVALIPRTFGNLQLQDINWIPVSGTPRGDTILHTNFTAHAIYGGWGSGERSTGFEHTAVYRGTVTRVSETENIFSIIYQGERIAPDFTMPWSHIGVGFAVLVLAVGVTLVILKGLPAFGGRRKRIAAPESVEFDI